MLLSKGADKHCECQGLSIEDYILIALRCIHLCEIREDVNACINSFYSWDLLWSLQMVALRSFRLRHTLDFLLLFNGFSNGLILVGGVHRCSWLLALPCSPNLPLTYSHNRNTWGLLPEKFCNLTDVLFYNCHNQVFFVPVAFLLFLQSLAHI